MKRSPTQTTKECRIRAGAGGEGKGRGGEGKINTKGEQRGKDAKKEREFLFFLRVAAPPR